MSDYIMTAGNRFKKGLKYINNSVSMDAINQLKSKHYNSRPVGGPDLEIKGESSVFKASWGQSFILGVTKCLKILILLAGLVLTLIMLPIIPFLWVSYKGFHGKYGIIKLFRDNYNVYQL